MPFEYNPPQEPYLDIVYHDEDILVLNKPSGLLTVPGKGEHLKDCLERRAQKKFPNALIIHRLDMDTSGLIILGLNKAAHRYLSIQFQIRKVSKKYTALIYGNPQNDNGNIDLPLICDWPNRPKQMVDHENGKPSQTAWKVISNNQNKTRIELVPYTGRSHQLRVHMMSIGHPILGDRFYAHEEALNSAERLCLHASELTIIHPVSQKKMTFNSPEEF